MTEQERIAAFIAERGITKIAEGEATLSHMTARDWHKAAQDTITIQARQENTLIDQRIDYGTHVVNGLGEAVYLGG